MSPDDRRLEELTLNSSAPPGQLLYDGWILRLAPGKAKRARSINPVYPSARPLTEKIAHCEQLYAGAGLPAIFRLTPFTQPAQLDALLESRGYGSFDLTSVMSMELRAPLARSADVREVALDDLVESVGILRGSAPAQRAGHLARLRGCPLPMGCAVIDREDSVVATGLSIREGISVGLFDIVTHEAHRRSGFARRIVETLLARVWDEGVRHAYLQVDAANAPAIALYATFGFAERYRYWYRGRPGEQH